MKFSVDKFKSKIDKLSEVSKNVAKKTATTGTYLITYIIQNKML